MPFGLYDVTRGSQANRYTFVRTAALAGGAGPLRQVQRSKNGAGITPHPWHADCDELVAAIPGTTPGQEIVIDLKPNVAQNVSLYRLLDVWGFSHAEWTPLALRLEVLFVDLTDEDPKLFKSSFSDEGADRSLVGEFLYVQGGTSVGTWNWGRVGSVNGALLWPDAFDYLSGELGKGLS